jgi:hypothetical protein
MKKTALIAITAATMLTASVGFAAPLTDYSAGKIAIDLTWRNSDINAKTSSDNISFDKKYNLDWGITNGLGNKFAIQYNGYNAKAKDTVEYSDTSETYKMSGKLKTQEFNVLYKLNQNLSAYTGVVRVKGTFDSNDTINGVTTLSSDSTDTKNKIQFGLIGSTKIADKTIAYASVAVASDFTNWKIGLSQEITPNIELNVDYRRLQAKNLAVNNAYINNVDITTKGLGFGVTYKF